MLAERALGGVFVPVVTPFDSLGRLDVKSFEALVDRLVRKGVHGLVLNDTLGEAPAAHAGELDALIETARGVAGDLPLLVDAGSGPAAETAKTIARAKSLGADAALVQPPRGFRPSPQAVARHVREAARAGLPIILCDPPFGTGRSLNVETIQALMDLEGIVGLKESSGSIARFLTLARTLAKPILCGADKLFFGAMCYGGKGGILASANVDTEQFVHVHALFRDGQIDAALRSFEQLLPLIRFVHSEPHPGPLKWLLAERGHIRSDRMRLPGRTMGCVSSDKRP
ncbi:4-hydroxy-tetrahydrodipicolinate synthase [Paenibacillus sp. UNC496MF]|uniref:dihydrodipicolinate synthase family protein n=1 Tax=Paenibacillus sp. UNC496MF TaxID=1502753 RepID=UPI0008EEC8D7|nr:dihydrodipicolinate synthase family protein [Paenibacillus sp. UNC496MF]SFJ35662.1 4-hydroxy-tetrahydrodipicolinate synthase [Paenibacillus sp. UNC496MF]